MMKRIVLALTFLLLFISVSAQSEWICRPGFNYDISQSPNWGKGKPVVTNVYPYSSAEQAGLKQGDVIEEIDGIDITTITSDEISQLLNPAGKNEFIITISNLATPSRQLLIRKECKRENAITEDQLAMAFSMYSLESTSERTFICPFKTGYTLEAIDFSEFKTFGFPVVDEGNSRMEEAINDCIEKELTKKGLRLESNPDMLVETFYIFDKNPNFRGTNRMLVEKEHTYRFDVTKRHMVKLPFLHYSSAEAEAEYFLQLGFRLIDRKVNPGRVLWECEANELLEESYRLDDYARLHIPLMLMQYPYTKYTRNVEFKVDQRIYNYTGISYDIDNLELVVDVDRTSPAYTAGVRPRDVIERIEKHRLNRTVDDYTAAYKRFITETMKYRDPETVFTDANGFRRCMYWDKFKYTQVADYLQNAKNLSPFAYLFYYAPYVNPTGTNTCTFRIKRGKETQEVVIRPAVRTETTITVN